MGVGEGGEGKTHVQSQTNSQRRKLFLNFSVSPLSCGESPRGLGADVLAPCPRAASWQATSRPRGPIVGPAPAWEPSQGDPRPPWGEAHPPGGCPSRGCGCSGPPANASPLRDPSAQPRGSPCAVELLERGSLINPSVEAAIFSADASAEEAMSTARWHRLLQQEAERGPSEPSLGCETPGASGTFPRSWAGRVSPPCRLRAGGVRSWGHCGWVAIIYRPSGQRLGEAARPLLARVFPLGGCLRGWPGAPRGQLHHCHCSPLRHSSGGPRGACCPQSG